jgi:hypothetical protein
MSTKAEGRKSAPPRQFQSWAAAHDERSNTAAESKRFEEVHSSSVGHSSDSSQPACSASALSGREQYGARHGQVNCFDFNRSASALLFWWGYMRRHWSVAQGKEISGELRIADFELIEFARRPQSTPSCRKKNAQMSA